MLSRLRLRPLENILLSKKRINVFHLERVPASSVEEDEYEYYRREHANRHIEQHLFVIGAVAA